MNEAVLVCEDLGKTYTQGGQTLTVLDKVDLCVNAGEKLAIIGASGSGKSTLLNLLGGLDAPDAGDVRINGRSLLRLDDGNLSRLRNDELGFVYQFHHLLPEFTALENVAMPLLIRGVSRTDANKQAASLLAKVGLAERVQHRPSALSGGERQRVAIARALVNDPACVLMDEPTGNLDSEASNRIVQLISQLACEINTAFIIVTHDKHVAATNDRVMALRDGCLVNVDLSQL